MPKERKKKKRKKPPEENDMTSRSDASDKATRVADLCQDIVVIVRWA